MVKADYFRIMISGEFNFPFTFNRYSAPFRRSDGLV